MNEDNLRDYIFINSQGLTDLYLYKNNELTKGKNTPIIRDIINKKIPITKEFLEKAKNWIKNANLKVKEDKDTIRKELDKLEIEEIGYKINNYVFTNKEQLKTKIKTKRESEEIFKKAEEELFETRFKDDELFATFNEKLKKLRAMKNLTEKDVNKLKKDIQDLINIDSNKRFKILMEEQKTAGGKDRILKDTTIEAYKQFFDSNKELLTDENIQSYINLGFFTYKDSDNKQVKLSTQDINYITSRKTSTGSASVPLPFGAKTRTMADISEPSPSGSGTMTITEEPKTEINFIERVKNLISNEVVKARLIDFIDNNEDFLDINTLLDQFTQAYVINYGLDNNNFLNIINNVYFQTYNEGIRNLENTNISFSPNFRIYFDELKEDDYIKDYYKLYEINEYSKLIELTDTLTNDKIDDIKTILGDFKGYRGFDDLSRSIRELGITVEEEEPATTIEEETIEELEELPESEVVNLSTEVEDTRPTDEFDPTLNEIGQEQPQNEDPPGAPIFVQSDKIIRPKYHKRAILNYFGSLQWKDLIDLQLMRNVLFSKYTKEEVNFLIDTLIEEYRKRLLIKERKTKENENIENLIVEYHELIQLQTLFERNLVIKGTKALVNVKDLFNLYKDANKGTEEKPLEQGERTRQKPSVVYYEPTPERQQLEHYNNRTYDRQGVPLIDRTIKIGSRKMPNPASKYF